MYHSGIDGCRCWILLYGNWYDEFSHEIHGYEIDYVPEENHDNE